MPEPRSLSEVAEAMSFCEAKVQQFRDADEKRMVVRVPLCWLRGAELPQEWLLTPKDEAPGFLYVDYFVVRQWRIDRGELEDA